MHGAFRTDPEIQVVDCDQTSVALDQAIDFDDVRSVHRQTLDAE